VTARGTTEPAPATPLPSAAELTPRGVTLCGVSKSWALPGLRIGWLVSKDTAVLEQVAALKDYTTICSSAPSEVSQQTGLCSGGCMNVRCG
jgi:aspartate/methionine/tyrosine aminotransferase